MDSKALEAAVSRGVVSALGRAPRSILSLVGGRTTNRDGDRLEPEVAAALRLMKALPEADVTQVPVAASRRRLDEEAALFAGAVLPMAEVRDIEIPSFSGVIPARLYRAHRSHADRLLVYFHGGGWVVGSLASHDATCRFLARHAGVSVLAVDYRLAPEDPFPAAVEDARTAFMYAASSGEEWGHDIHRIAVGGDSAGGNLAAVLAQQLRRAAVRPAFQLLLVPATDLTSESASRREFGEGYYLTTKQIDWYQEQYVGDADARDPRLSPLLAEDLSDLPPAYVAVAGFDPLRDEGEAYARRMAEAGVQVSLRRHGGLIHPFANTVGMGRSGREAMLEACGALRLGVGAGLAR